VLIGLYGGTFDPVHVGHTHAALQVCAALDLHEVRMVLAARPGHRGAPHEDSTHRWRMLCLACDQHEQLVADDTELRRTGTSYTIDTVAAVRNADSGMVPCWILGQDAFATLPSWYRWRSLLEFCNLIVVARPGDTRVEPPEVQSLCHVHEVEQFDRGRVGQIYRLHMPMKEVSATDIRARIASGAPVEHLLAAPVYAYIRQHRLYVNTENVI